jgi:hypothetical protein
MERMSQGPCICRFSRLAGKLDKRIMHGLDKYAKPGCGSLCVEDPAQP